MKEFFSIGEVSKLFDINKKTLKNKNIYYVKQKTRKISLIFFNI